MRVLMFSKALVVGAYQRKLEELAKYDDVELVVIVPPFWKEGEHCIDLERRYTEGYRLAIEKMVFNGNFHLHFYPCLSRYLREFKPHVFHIDEEPYNFATFHAMLLGRRAGVKTVFFTWQNIKRRLPLPFRLIERYNLNVADYAIAGSEGAADVLREKGYHGPVATIPQFGVDAEIYSPGEGRGKRQEGGEFAQAEACGYISPNPRAGRFTIGYIGRLYEMKGLVSLVEAVAGLSGDWELRVTGEGPFRAGMEDLARRLGVAERTRFIPYAPSAEIPRRLRELDVLVLPSLTMPNWKEQFGRVLIEAMACGVPVVGSDSGEIPSVIGDAGLIFPEAQSDALRQRLASLMADEEMRQSLAWRGRERVLARFTQSRVAEETRGVYLDLVGAQKERNGKREVEGGPPRT